LVGIEFIRKCFIQYFQTIHLQNGICTTSGSCWGRPWVS
jgi:hypothetical protein